eukprot:6222032-Lingulodinium_polyedra.AAC.1
MLATPGTRTNSAGPRAPTHSSNARTRAAMPWPTPPTSRQERGGAVRANPPRSAGSKSTAARAPLVQNAP